ncbi:MAG TPA: protein translocase subunit SecF [Candidatus Binatia bacterium]|jgi:preprotein translocase subunit SecF|nr:protein translocase subunit SecF [Candidatus Binatia bacterium]
MELIKPGTRIPFTRYRYVAVAISSVVNLAVLILLFTKGPLLGVDFAGGTVAQLKFSKPVTIPEIRNALGELGAGDTVVQDFGQQGSNEFLVRLQRTSAQLGELGELIKEKLTKQFGSGGFEIRRIESVGPKVGSELRQKGAWSVIAATIMMGVYIWLRFELRFGLGAVVALIHDVLVTIGALIVANYEFDLTIIAALLTVVGFSVNDTVIVCDRVRENMRKIKRESLEGIINTSINETLSRTIITTGTAILVLLALFVLGGGVIRPFAFALLVGFFSGVYSTIFIASPVVLFWEKRPIRKPTGALSVSSTKK